MDTAEADQLRYAISAQGIMLGNHEQTLREVMEARGLTTGCTNLGNCMDQLQTQLSAGASGATPSQPAPPPAPVDPTPTSCEPFIPIPARYSGELGQCGQFLIIT